MIISIFNQLIAFTTRKRVTKNSFSRHLLCTIVHIEYKTSKSVAAIVVRDLKYLIGYTV